MKIFLHIIVAVGLISCTRPENESGGALARQIENFERQIKEQVAQYEKTTLILDNPTNRCVVYQIDDIRDTLPPLVYREIPSDTHKSHLIIFDSLGRVATDTSVKPGSSEEVFINLSRSKYTVLMKEYKEIALNFKSRQDAALEEIQRMEDAKKPHVYGEVSDSADQNRKHEKIKYVRPSATNDYYEVITYYQAVKIGPEELLVKKFWSLGPEQNFGRLENMKHNPPDKYLRELVREKELEAKKYFGSINITDYITAVINEGYVKTMYKTVMIVNSYPPGVQKEIAAENAASSKFMEACKVLIKYCKTPKGLTQLSKDNSEMMKKYDLRTLWPNCRDSSALVKKYFYKEHIKALNSLPEARLF